MADDMRGRGDERRRLLIELERERSQLFRNIETCRIRDIEHPFIGDWSLKDIVGHVASWEAEVLVAIREMSEGQRPSLLDFPEEQLDRWNWQHVERKRDLNFWSLMEQLRGGRVRLMAELESISDEALTDTGSTYLTLVKSIIDHDREHWHEIAARLAGMSGVRATGPISVPAETHATS
ncbi:MAG: ClbS/DfsB family four-helix bundle protein [Dehalococcoidia bacterium]|nr:ClbS/DfsB family four-helix bundle protein [Dehalococcoidia bacterium]MCB9486001.1 ClbS/DfsB family four-helix bundle protein [Thermoflexaceae bacterium]